MKKKVKPVLLTTDIMHQILTRLSDPDNGRVITFSDDGKILPLKRPKPR